MQDGRPRGASTGSTILPAQAVAHAGSVFTGTTAARKVRSRMGAMQVRGASVTTGFGA
jgi:hypothetical protein